MRNFIESGLGIIIVILIHSFIGKISFIPQQYFNIFSILVIVFAVKKGEIYGGIMGTVCGLIQDSFSLGIFGMAGLSKTITGFLAGYIHKRINIIPVIRNFIFMYILLSLEFFVFKYLYWFILSENVSTGKNMIFLQPLYTTIAGVIVFYILRKLKYIE